MTNEEFEKSRDSILSQQAQFAGMLQLSEAQAKTQRVVMEIEEIVARFASGIDESFKDVKVKINALIDSRMQTEQDLKILSAYLERYLRKRRKGN
jgi:hypothetical protein